MGDDLVWMDLTSLAEEKYPDPKEKWIKIKEEYLIKKKTVPKIETDSTQQYISYKRCKEIEKIKSRLAQLVEHRSYEPKVKGSTPLPRTIPI